MRKPLAVVAVVLGAGLFWLTVKGLSAPPSPTPLLAGGSGPTASPPRAAPPWRGPPEARLDPGEFINPPAEAQADNGPGKACEAVRNQANGVRLHLAGARELALMGVRAATPEERTCVWTIGAFSDGGAYTAYLRESFYGGSGPAISSLQFIKGGRTYRGEYPTWRGLSFRIAEGRLLAENPTAAVVSKLPSTGHGPPHRATLAGVEAEFAYASEREAYSRALAEPMGSARRERPCKAVVVTTTGERLERSGDDMRHRLAQAGYGPDLVDGTACIWRAGQVRGEDGRRYDIYLHEIEWGEAISHQPQQRLILMSAGRYVGAYLLHRDDFVLRGPDVLFEAARDPGKVLHIGPEGPPAWVVIDGETMALERGR